MRCINDRTFAIDFIVLSEKKHRTLHCVLSRFILCDVKDSQYTQRPLAPCFFFLKKKRLGIEIDFTAIVRALTVTHLYQTVNWFQGNADATLFFTM